MNSLDALERQLEQIQSRDSTLVELRHFLLEIEELINSPDYQALSPDDRGRLQAVRKDVMTRIQQQENGEASRDSRWKRFGKRNFASV